MDKTRRVLLKLSGEALAGPRKTGFDEETVKKVASQVKASVIKTMMTWKHGLWIDNAFAHESERLRSLERGAWWILSHDAAVEQRTPTILRQQPVVLASLPSHHHPGIVGGSGNHA